MNAIEGTPGVTGEVILEAEFDGRIAGHGRFFLSLILLASIVGIPLIPFWLIFSLWYYPEFLRRISARLTSQAVEIKKGVFFRKEVTIPLDRITDLRLHDGPLMRYFGLRGVAIETAGQAGRATGSEGNLIGVIDGAAFRDAVLAQRQKVIDRENKAAEFPSVSPDDNHQLLTEIRDILARIENLERGDAR